MKGRKKRTTGEKFVNLGRWLEIQARTEYWKLEFV